MTFTSPYGFDGTVSEGTQAADLTVHPGEYGVGGFLGSSGDCKVTIKTGTDRTVTVAAGYAWGKGVSGENGAGVDVQAAVIASGERWDTVVLRRDLSTNTITPTILTGTSAKSLAATREVNYASDKDDQPIALIRLVAGQSNVQEVVDLRCWAANGGVVAASADALAYLATPASTVWVDGGLWVREVNPATGAVAWQAYSPPALNVGAAFSGTYTAGKRLRNFIDRRTWTTDSNGDFIVMSLGQFAGILRPNMIASSTFQLFFAFRMLSGNLVCRLWDTNGLRPNTSFAGTADVLYW